LSTSETNREQTNKQKKRQNDNPITKGKWWDFGKAWRDKLDARQTGLGESVFVVFSTRRVEANVRRFLSCDAHLLTGPYNSIPTVTTPHDTGIVVKEAVFATSSLELE